MINWLNSTGKNSLKKRERIPERVVHAKGAGAHGDFEVTADVTKYCKADFLSNIGKKTPVFLRFSTVGGEKGSADTERDPRGFAIKFYTQEGNYDMVGNNTPVFFIRDPMMFPDFVHTQKRDPRTNLKDPNIVWDFWSLVPESLHQVTVLFSDRGTPDGYRFMNGYSSHTFKWINQEGEVFYVKLHFKSNQGIKNMTGKQAAEMKSKDPDYATRDLQEAIDRGDYPSWTANVQIMPEKEAETYRWNVFDITKVWPHKDYPLIPFGKLTLNRVPDNYFADVEQSAFAPTNVVPGIEPSEDRLLQGRLFSYPDTHRHRLGGNHDQIPINCPYRARTVTTARDGYMCVNGNQGSRHNYYPNSSGSYQTCPKSVECKKTYSGIADRVVVKASDDDYVQAGELYRKVFDDEQRDHLIENIVGAMKGVKPEIQKR